MKPEAASNSLKQPEAASRKRNRSNLDLLNENHVDGYETSDESGNSLN